jgi:hypothetical protein
VGNVRRRARPAIPVPAVTSMRDDDWNPFGEDGDDDVEAPP